MEGVRATMRWQRRVVVAAIITAILSALIAVCGCSSVEVAEDAVAKAETEADKRFEQEWLGRHLTLITDTEEGCQYLFCNNAYGAAMVQLTDKYGHPLLASGYEREYEVSMSDDDGE